MKRIVFQASISLISSLILLPALGQVQGSNWTHITDLPVTRAGFSVNHIEGKLYVIGGEVYHPGNALADVSIYDIEDNVWTVGTPMPTARFLIPKLTIGNKIYAIGGNKSSLESGHKVEVYDGNTDEWTSAADLPTSRVYAAGCVLDGKIYVMGGFSHDMFSGEDIYGLTITERYDPETDTWDTCAPMPTGRFAFTSCALNGKIYAIGGSKPISEDAEGYAIVEEYDPVTDQWTAKSSMHYPRFELTCTVIEGEIWAMYGFPNGSASPVYPHYEVYDVDSDKWTLQNGTEDLHPEGYAAIHAIYADNSLYILGGYSGFASETLRPEVYVYDTIANPVSNVRELVNQDIRIFPNPAGEQLTIQTNIAGQFDMVVTTLNGQIINNTTCDEPTQLLDLSSYPKGVYVITIRAMDFVTTRKIIKL